MLYYDSHLEIQDGRQTNQYLIADNIFIILSIKNVGKVTNYFKTLICKITFNRKCLRRLLFLKSAPDYYNKCVLLLNLNLSNQVSILIRHS